MSFTTSRSKSSLKAVRKAVRKAVWRVVRKGKLLSFVSC